MVKKFLQKNKNNNEGFTIIEVLVAIAIFVSCVTLLLSVTGDGLHNTTEAQNRLTANYFAQEGVELVRAARDSYFLQNPTDTTMSGFADTLSACNTTQSGSTDANGCGIDLTTLSTFACTNDFDQWNSVFSNNDQRTEMQTDPCTLLANNTTGIVEHMQSPDSSNYTASNFVRQIFISTDNSSVGGEPAGLRITSRVYWLEGNAIEHVQLDNFLTAWPGNSSGTITPPGSCPTITLSPLSTSSGNSGDSYDQVITTTPSADSYTYAITSGTVPTELRFFENGDGRAEISGSLDKSGTFTITATDNTESDPTTKNPCTGSQTYTITVNPVNTPTVPTVFIGVTNNPGATVSLESGAAANIYWTSSSDATSCQIDSAKNTSPPSQWPTTVPTNGNFDVTPPQTNNYTYGIKCENAAGLWGYSQVTVNRAAVIASTLTFAIKLPSESTYHTYPAGSDSQDGYHPIKTITATQNEDICSSDNPCDANQDTDFAWSGANVSNCSVVGKYGISSDKLGFWDTPTPVTVTSAQSTADFIVPHYGHTAFTMSCTRGDNGKTISDTVSAYYTFGLYINQSPTAGILNKGTFNTPANIATIGVGSSGFPGQGGGLAANGKDGDTIYFNKDNGTANGDPFFEINGGKGGSASVASGGTAAGGAGGTVYYPPIANVVYPPAPTDYDKMFAGLYSLGLDGASATTQTGGAGGKQSAPVDIISGRMGNACSGNCDVGINGTTSILPAQTGGGGGGGPATLTIRFYAQQFESFIYQIGNKSLDLINTSVLSLSIGIDG